MIQYLDPERKIFRARLFRECCVVTKEGIYIKDLRVLGRDLKDVVLVDNATYSFGQ